MSNKLIFLVVFLITVPVTGQASSVFFDHKATCAERVKNRLVNAEHDCIQVYQRNGLDPANCYITEEAIDNAIYYNCELDEQWPAVEKMEEGMPERDQ